MHPNPLVYICLPCRRQSQDFAIPGVQAAKSCLWVNPSRNGQCTSKEWAKYPVKRAKTVSNLKNLFRQVLTQLPCEAHMLQHIGTAWAWVLVWSAGSIVVRMMVFVCFCKGATWVTTKRSQPTLRDLKQSLESLLLDTSRFSTGSVSASGSFWKLLDRHVTAGIQYARAAPKWHLLLGYLMTPRVSFFAYWPTLLYCQS